ncbi:hypothetical protein HDU97_002683 [Phlyctochytrium planicorne]|nr:hypothetical protein HDU97_002683 [Phlyctochytrium planicorne]
MSSSNNQHDAVLASIQALLISNPDMMAAMQHFMTGQLPYYFVKVPGFGNVAPSKAKVDSQGVYSLPSDISDAPKVSIPSEPMGQLQSHLPAYLELVSRVKELKRVETDVAAKSQVVQDLEKSIENDRRWIEVLEQQEAQGVKDSQKSEGFSFKSVKAKITGKSPADEGNHHKLEDIRKEKITKETSISESTAKLEKARIGLQRVKSDALTLSIARQDLHSLLEMALSTHSDNNYLNLMSALQDSKNLSDQIRRDTKAYRAAQSLSRSMHNNFKEILVQLEEVRKARLSWQDEAIRVGLAQAENCMDEAEESRKLLCELIAGISDKLPRTKLQIPPILLEYNSHGIAGSMDISIMQDFILRRNVEDVKKSANKIAVLIGWLNKAVDSMETVDAVVSMDAVGKEMQLNVFRMGCFERLAASKGSKPEAMGEAELSLILASPQ